jgi:putative beta barrel porin BBP7
LTNHIDLHGGYTFLFWANPIRAADQVDTTINSTPGGPGRPQVLWREDGFWAQGVNAGMEIHW